MFALVLVLVGFASVSGTSSDVPRECYPLFSCSNRFLDIGKFFYDGDTLKDVSEETVDELCRHMKTKLVCKEAEKCKEMHFVTDMMAEIETAVCVQYKKKFVYHLHKMIEYRDIQSLTTCYNEPEFRSKFVECVQDSFKFTNPSTCGFVDKLKRCASMFQRCRARQHSSVVETMLRKYGTTLCNLHKFNVGA